MKKILRSKIFLVIITAIICSSISVYATYLYNSTQITYNDTSVENAINFLVRSYNSNYNYYSSQIASLSNNVTNNSQLVNNLGNTSKMSFYSGSSTKSFALGYRPDYIYCFADTSTIYTGGDYTVVAYNKNFDSAHILRANTIASSLIDISSFYSITNTGFTWKIVSDKWNGLKVYCFTGKQAS